jgi:hypothetical protein
MGEESRPREKLTTLQLDSQIAQRAIVSHQAEIVKFERAMKDVKYDFGP